MALMVVPDLVAAAPRGAVPPCALVPPREAVLERVGAAGLAVGHVAGLGAGGRTPREERRQAAREARARRMASAATEGSLSDLELTRRGRWVLSSMALVLATGVAVMGGGALASTPDVPLEVTPYTVAQGDNLWGIAEGLARPGEDLRDVVDLIVGVNGRSTAALWAGEQIMLPVRD